MYFFLIHCHVTIFLNLLNLCQDNIQNNCYTDKKLMFEVMLMPIWIKISILWFLWALSASASYLVQTVDPQNRLYAPWVSGLLTATATAFLIL